MRVLGVHVHSQDRRFHARFAVVDGENLVTASSYRAPSGESESVQHHELAVRVGQLLDEHDPDRVAIRRTETGQQRRSLISLAVPLRAEGAVLSAAGAHAVECESIAGATLRAKLPGRKGSTPSAVERICRGLRGQPVPARCEIAAAVARVVAESG